MRREHTIQIHITDDCGVNCPHCYIGDQRLSSPSHMSYDTFIKTVEQEIELVTNISHYAENEVFPVFHITGGDPLKHPDIWEMLSYLKKRNYKIGILGNPTSTGKLKQLKGMGVISYQISIDGLSLYHDIIRGKGKYNQAIQFLRKCKSLDIKSFIMMNVTKDNISQIIPLYERLSKLEAPPFSFAFARVATIGNAKTNGIESYEMKPLDYKEIFKQLDELQKDSPVKITMKDPLWSLYLYEQEKLKAYEEIFHGGCGMGISLYSIDVDGTITPCRRYPEKLGNIEKNTLNDIYFNSDLMQKYRDPENFGECKNCEIFYHCRGCPAISNMLKDPQCWKGH